MKLTTSNQFFISLLALIVLGPFCVLAIQSFNLNEADLATWSFSVKQLAPLTFNSLILVLTTAFLSLVWGGGIALIVGLTDIKFRRFIKYFSILPLALPLYVLSFIYLGLLEYSGVFHTFLRGIGFDLYTYFPIKSFLGVGLVFSLGLFPYIFLMTSNALNKIGYDQIKAAMSLGKSRYQILILVILPALKSAIFSGVIIVSLDTLSDFGGVSAFNYDTFTTSIYNAWSSLYSFGVAARLSFFLLIMALLLFWLERKVATHSSASKNLVGQMPPLFILSVKGQILSSLFCWGIIFFSLIIPILTLFSWSISAIHYEWGQHYFLLIRNSFGLSIVAGVLLFCCGLLLNLIKRSGINKLSKWLLTLSQVGYAIPGNVIAVAVFIFMTFVFRSFGWEIGLALAIINLVVGYLVRFLSVSFRNFRGPMDLIPIELDKAAQSLGQNKFSMWMKLHLPLIIPSSWGILILLFLEVFKEMPLTLMLRPTGYDTLAVKIYELTSEGEWERAAVAGSCLVCLALVITLASRKRFEI